jgi:hypothetical protein
MVTPQLLISYRLIMVKKFNKNIKIPFTHDPHHRAYHNTTILQLIFERLIVYYQQLKEILEFKIAQIG